MFVKCKMPIVIGSSAINRQSSLSDGKHPLLAVGVAPEPRILPDSCVTLSDGRESVPNQVKDERTNAIQFFKAVDAADVVMVQRGEPLGFPLKPGQTIGIGGEQICQDFDRHLAVELGILRAIDLAHAARAE